MANHPYRGLAVLLSFLLPGLGQIYNQQFTKGTRFMIGYVVSWVLSFIVIGWFFLIVVWIWSMVDAYQSTGRVTPPPRRAPQGERSKTGERRGTL